jgi:hypothetical protein
MGKTVKSTFRELAIQAAGQLVNQVYERLHTETLVD